MDNDNRNVIEKITFDPIAMHFSNSQENNDKKKITDNNGNNGNNENNGKKRKKEKKYTDENSDNNNPIEKIKFDVDSTIINFGDNDNDNDTNNDNDNENDSDGEELQNLGKNNATNKSNVNIPNNSPNAPNNDPNGNTTNILNNKPNIGPSNIPIYEDLSVPWNRIVMTQLKKIGEKSIGYKWMHEQEILHNDKWNSIYSILEIILLAIIGTIQSGEFIGFVGNFGLGNYYGAVVSINAVQLGLVFIYAVVKGLKDFGNYDKLVFEHRLAKLKFSEIYSDIEKQFSRPISRRCDGDTFLEAKSKEFNDLMFNVPTISKDIVNQYMKATENEDIYKPLLIGHFDKIEIVIDNHNDNLISLRKNDNETHSRKRKINKNTNDNTDMDTDNDNHDNEIMKYQIDRWLQNF